MNRTEIAWTDRSWNPVRGCSRVSEGCRNCYAERMAARFSDPGMWGHGFARHVAADTKRRGGVPAMLPRWTGRVELVPEKLDEPLRLRKPQRIFVNSTSDLFHEALSFEDVAAVYGTMVMAQQHTFQVLTKRPKRRLEFYEWRRAHVDHAEDLKFNAALACEIGCWPLPNVWEGVSIEDQKTADERIPLLLQTPSAVRFVSYEPALGPVDFRWGGMSVPDYAPHRPLPKLDLVIVGGESGPGARPCDVAWLRSVVEQCREAGVACFVKQLGARPLYRSEFDVDPDAFRAWDCEHAGEGWPKEGFVIRPRHPKGGNPAEWPEDLRVREMPR